MSSAPNSRGPRAHQPPGFSLLRPCSRTATARNTAENKTRAGNLSNVVTEAATARLKSLRKISLFTTEQIYSGEDSTAVAKDPDK